jgi:hypothetical protein
MTTTATTRRWLRLVDFILWVGVASTVVLVACAVPALLLADPLVLKYLAFLVGVVLFGVGSVAIQPKRPGREDERLTLDTRAEARFEAWLHRLPPLAAHRLPLDERVGRDGKLFATSLVVLAASFVMEVGFGVAV